MLFSMRLQQKLDKLCRGYKTLRPRLTKYCRGRVPSVPGVVDAYVQLPHTATYVRSQRSLILISCLLRKFPSHAR